MTMLEVYVAREVYQERVRKAEQAWRFREIGKVAHKPRLAGLRNYLGNMLIGSGTRLKGKGTGRITYAGAS